MSSTPVKVSSSILDMVKQSTQTGKPMSVIPSPPTTPTAEKIAAKMKRPIPKGHKAYSKLFGKAATGIEHAVKVFKDTDWDESIRMFIPTETKGYVYPEDATELVVMGIQHNDKTLAVGPTGSGKTSLVTNVCAKLRIPVIRINFSGDMESSVVFGQPTVESGTIGYAHGPAGILGKHGGVLLCDEVSVAPAEVAMGMQWMLEDDGKIFLKEMPSSVQSDKLVVPHKMFRLICTDNTVLQGDITGRHAGVSPQNTAFLDRFNTIVNVPYLHKGHELKVITDVCKDISYNDAEAMLKLAALVRTAYEQGEIGLTMSPRTLINWANKTVYWQDPYKALKIAFFDKLLEDDKKVVNSLVKKVYGKFI